MNFLIKNFKLNGVNQWILGSVRFLSESVPEKLQPDDPGYEEEEEILRSKEQEIERKRNKSRLYHHDYNLLHDKMPYTEPIYEHQTTEAYKRRMFGRYGNSSGVNPGICWPTKEDLKELKEYENVAHPYSITEMMVRCKEKREQQDAIRKAREQDILRRTQKVEQWKEEHRARIKKKEIEAQAAREKREKLIEEVRRYFGFKIDPRDDRFKEMLEKKEKEAKKASKEAKKKEREAKLLAKLTGQPIDSKEENKSDSTTSESKENKLISDDEDETHPNIDTPSLFRWRHEARVERMEEMKKEREILAQKKYDNQRKLKSTKEKLDSETNEDKCAEIKKEIETLEKEAEEIKKNETELSKKEQKAPWNVDTISKSGFSKTVFNTKSKPQREELSEEQREARMKTFIKENEKQLKEFGMLQKYDDSKRYLQEHPHLVSEDTANYLVIWCINLQMEEKSNLMEHVAHQCICMQYILELSKQLDVDPRACVGSFFSRIQVTDVEYKASFDDELNSFKDRIRKRAQEKLDAAVKEVEEEERKARLGPGGLDPVDVFESLPEELKKCFESQDIPLLQATIAKMPEDEACYHMKRCVDSGLWIPDAGKKNEPTEDKPESDK